MDNDRVEELGCEALEAYDWMIPLRTARDNRPDLMILELALADHDSLEVIWAIGGDAV